MSGEFWSKKFPAILAKRDVWVIILALTTIFAFALNYYGLARGMEVVTPHLFYLPIVIAGYWFPRRGILFSVFIGMAYLAMVYIMTYPDINSITSATARFYVLVAIGLIVATLSSNLKEQEDRYHGIFDYSEAGIFLVRYNPEEMRIEEANERGANILGYRPGELTGLSVFDIWPDEEEYENFMQRLCKEGTVIDFEARLLTKKNSIIMVLVSAGRLPEKMMVFTIIDITERKSTEEELKEAKERYQGLYNNALVGLVRTTVTDGKVLEANEQMARMFGYEDSDEFIGHFIFSHNYVDVRTRKELISSLLENKTVSNFEARIRKRDGSIIWTRFWARIFPEKGYLEGVFIDVTDEKISAQALGESEERYKRLIENIPDYVIVFSQDRIIFANPATADAVGWPIGELKNSSIYDFIAPDCHDLVHKNTTRILGGEQVEPFEVGIWSHDTFQRTAIMNTTLVRYRDERAILAVLTDITDRKHFEDALKASKDQYVTTIDAMSDGIYLLDRDLRLILINSIFMRWLKAAGTNNEVIGKRVDEVLPSLKNTIVEEFEEVFSTGRIEVSTDEIYIENKRFIFETRKIPVYEDGLVVRVVTIMRNITRQKQIEEERKLAYEQIENNIEQFAILGDHIRNPMQVIVGLADLQGGPINEQIQYQAQEIDKTIDQLDKGWIESEKIREFVKKYYGIGK